MRGKRWVGLCICCFIGIFAISLPAEAQDQSKGGYEREKVRCPTAFRKGKKSLQIIAGVFTSPILTGIFPETQDLDYGQINVRFGWMLNEPKDGPSIFRGNFEALFGLNHSVVLRGSGNFISGLNLLLRYNFVKPEARLIPYVQGLVGIVYNDIYKDEEQQAIGQGIEFVEGLGVGLHFFISHNWSVDVEAAYQHISNAGLADRNDGNNAAAGFLGVTRFF